MNALPGKHYFEQRQRNRLYEIVIRLVEDAALTDGLRKKDMAAKIGVDPSQISRWLSGPSNWTLDSVSDMLWALGGELDFNFVRFEDRARQNRPHRVNDVEVATGRAVIASPDLAPPTSSGTGTQAASIVSVNR